jgi:hypothetical protein
MKLLPDLSLLQSMLRRMGASPSGWNPQAQPLKARQDWLETIPEIAVETDLGAVMTGPGSLFIVDGQTVVLHIRDTFQDPQILLHSKKDARRFHLMECTTIQNMRAQGRGERYVQTNRQDGSFRVTGKDPETGQITEPFLARLGPCIVCLKELNYRGYRDQRKAQQKEIWDSFDLTVFFRTYQTFFRKRPARFDHDPALDQAVLNWPDRSRRALEAARWTCASCRVDLHQDPSLLYCGHRDGNGGNSRPDNITVLCLLCHADLPDAGHLRPTLRERTLIEGLRTTQSITVKPVSRSGAPF